MHFVFYFVTVVYVFAVSSVFEICKLLVNDPIKVKVGVLKVAVCYSHFHHRLAFGSK